MNSKSDSKTIWRLSISHWSALLLATLALGLVFHDAMLRLLEVWEEKEEYSFGYMIPFITAFFIWQKKDVLERTEFSGNWGGLALIVVGALLYVLGELSTIYLIIQYGMVIVVMGLALAMMGWQSFRVIAIPLAVLFFMIPLPQFFLREISNSLQLISSQLGVAFIRLFDISVYLEGNVIDLGSYKLQVVEACSGLRYLFPLMALGFIVAYLYQDALWKRVVIFVSTIPITILMNSFRIGAIGVLVEYWGIEMAEGFLHDFEGWVVFMACLLVLIGEMWLLARIGGEPKSLHQVFGIDMPEQAPSEAHVQKRKVPSSLVAGVFVMLAAVAVSTMLPGREALVPLRKTFAEFPVNIGDWRRGKVDQIESIYLDELKLDDYYLADYMKDGSSVNLYIAYYASQRKRQSAHSPRTCLPGGGWELQDIRAVELENDVIPAFEVNRAIIQKGERKQLVYYWFQGRGRVITNEYLVKWMIFWDSLMKSRTDGALVRVVEFVTPGEEIDEVERRMQSFVKEVLPALNDYVPG